MRIIFYSSYVEFCIKLIEYIKVNSLEDYFKIVNIDDLSERETKELGLTIIPTLIDSDIDTPFEGTKAWEYVRNQKYFNHPTNNVEYTKNGIPKPVIDEDTKANISKSGSGFIYVDQEVEKKFIDKDDKHNFDRVFEIKDNSNNKVVNVNNDDNKSSIKSIMKPINKIIKNPMKPPIQSTVKPQQPLIKPVSPIIKDNNNLNTIVNQRTIEDKKLLALMKLRKS
jgi:hypothetical protein